MNAKTIPGKVTITRNSHGKVLITVECATTSRRLLVADMSTHEFGNTVTGMGCRPATVELFDGYAEAGMIRITRRATLEGRREILATKPRAGTKDRDSWEAALDQRLLATAPDDGRKWRVQSNGSNSRQDDGDHWHGSIFALLPAPYDAQPVLCPSCDTLPVIRETTPDQYRAECGGCFRGHDDDPSLTPEGALEKWGTPHH